MKVNGRRGSRGIVEPRTLLVSFLRETFATGT